MEQAEVKITIQKTDNGNIRIKFKDGGSCLVKDNNDNMGLLASLEVELEYAIKKLNKPNPSQP